MKKETEIRKDERRKFVEKLYYYLFGVGSIKGMVELGNIYKVISEINSSSIKFSPLKINNQWKEYKIREDEVAKIKMILKCHLSEKSKEMYQKSHVPLQLFDKEYLDKIIKSYRF